MNLALRRVVKAVGDACTQTPEKLYIHTVMKSDADPLDFASGPPPEARIPIHAIRGRGAATATPHRFAKDARTVVDDGWDFPWDGEAQAMAPLNAAMADLEFEAAAVECEQLISQWS